MSAAAKQHLFEAEMGKVVDNSTTQLEHAGKEMASVLTQRDELAAELAAMRPRQAEWARCAEELESTKEVREGKKPYILNPKPKALNHKP